jgi:hypothetical protein
MATAVNPVQAIPGHAVPGPVPGHQNQDRLDHQVGRQRDERAADQPQCPPLPVLS